MNLSKHITEINLDPKTNKYQLTLKDNQKHEAEAVIVTIPVPQVLTQLKGSIGQMIGKFFFASFSNVEQNFSSRKSNRCQRKTFSNQIFDTFCRGFILSVIGHIFERSLVDLLRRQKSKRMFKISRC